MSSTDLLGCPEMEDLLSAYALDALGEDGERLVRAHLESCPGCRQALAGLQRAAASLAGLATRQAPPPSLYAHLMGALERVGRPAAPAALAASPGRRVPLTALVLPLAASVVAALLAVSLVMNFRLDRRVDRLKEENSALTARVAQLDSGGASGLSAVSQLSDRMGRLERESSTLTARLVGFVADDARIADAVNQVRVGNYLMATEGTRVMTLRSTRGGSASEGVLLVSADGRRAVMMVADMEQLPPTSAYQVWLMRQGQPVSVGQVRVDSSGWGSVYFRAPESVFHFDWVGLSEEGVAGGPAPSGEMVLGGTITSK